MGSYVAYENYGYVIRETSGTRRVLAGIIPESADGYDPRITYIITATDEYSSNHAKYEAITPLWIAEISYSTESIQVPFNYVCVWEEYTEGDRASLSGAMTNIRVHTRNYMNAAISASSSGTGAAYAKDYFTNCLPQTQTQQLTTPTGLVATNITSNSARLAWNAVENASAYKVEFRQRGMSEWGEQL